MYKTFRILRIVIALTAMTIPTWALITGYESVFVRMQILTAVLAGTGITLIFWAIVTLIYGRIYCSTVCPMGTLIDIVGWAGRSFGRKPRSFGWCSPSGKTRFFFLVAGLVFLLTGGALLPTLLDPYTAYSRMVEEFVARPLGRLYEPVAFSLSSMAIAVVTAVGVVAWSWRRGRVICNTVCPVGTLLGLGSARSVFHFEIDPDRCTNCKLCEISCKSQCIKIPDKVIDTSRCVVCFDCANICPCEAINYKTGRTGLDMPLMQSTARPQEMSDPNNPIP